MIMTILQYNMNDALFGFLIGMFCQMMIRYLILIKEKYCQETH